MALKTITLTCEACRREFHCRDRGRTRIVRFCSRACAGVAPKPRTPCEQCGKMTILRVCKPCYRESRRPYPRMAAWLAAFRNPGPCWVWTGANSGRYGYGKLTSHIYAHRAAWELSNGPIPSGLDVLHRCDNPPCCNPSHLFLGTARDNAADMLAKHRTPLGEERRLSKLTDAQVRDIRAASGLLTDIAARFGVSPSLIGLIRRGRRRTHVR